MNIKNIKHTFSYFSFILHVWFEKEKEKCRTLKEGKLLGKDLSLKNIMKFDFLKEFK